MILYFSYLKSKNIPFTGKCKALSKNQVHSRTKYKDGFAAPSPFPECENIVVEPTGVIVSVGHGIAAVRA